MIATRETFTISRSLEFLSEAELTKQIGYSREQWLLVLVKELIDNAMDNAEEIGVLPVVTVTIDDSSDEEKVQNGTSDDGLQCKLDEDEKPRFVLFTVRDNGSGIDPKTVEGMFDFSNRVSSRVGWRSVTRGAQGNAGKCLVALPYVLNPSKPGSVTIRAHGVRHHIAVGLDQLIQKPNVEYSRTEEKVQTGTSVEVQLPCKIDEYDKSRFVLFAQRYAALNPHLRLTVNLFGESRTWERTSETCPKWTAAEPDPPGWHNVESFERLVGACIVNDRQLGQDRPLRDFLRGFAGLKRSDTLKAVADETGLVRCNLSALVNCTGLDRNKTSRLLDAMQRNGKNPQP
jgi:DNA topoisomerase VI subunit B